MTQTEQNLLLMLSVANTLTIIHLLNLYYYKKKKKPTHQRTELTLTTTINKYKIKILSMSFNVKQWADANLSLIDSDTQQPVTATFDNITMVSSNPEVATVDTDVDGDGHDDIVGIAAGATNITFEADATYIDSVSGQSTTQHKTVDLRAEITTPSPTSENTELVVTLTAPQDLPTT